MREARIMVTLNHPCIVKLIGVTNINLSKEKPMMMVRGLRHIEHRSVFKFYGTVVWYRMVPHYGTVWHHSTVPYDGTTLRYRMVPHYGIVRYHTTVPYGTTLRYRMMVPHYGTVWYNTAVS